MKKSVLAFAISLAAASASACSAVIVGKSASATGRVIVGHNNDGPGPFVFRQALVPARDGRAAMFWSEVKATAGGPYAGDHFLNEHGVLIVSNGAGIMDEWDGVRASPSAAEDAAACLGGGVAYAFRRTIAERARSAREGVEIATNLLTQSGYSLYMGRIFTIADANEAWIVETPGGRRYAVRRCPDDAVVAIPNSFTIDRIRPGDLISPNIAAHGADFDFVRAYQGARTWRSNYSIFRLKGLYSVVAGVDVGNPETCPFSVRPNRKISLADVKRGLRTHYEGLPWAGAEKHPAKDPKVRTPVCRDSTVQSIVCGFGATVVETEFGLIYGRPCEHEYDVYRPFAGKLPSTAVTGAEAARRLDEHEIPLGGLALPSATFDRGGLTFDLEANSRRIYGEDGRVHDYRALLSVCSGYGSNVWAEALAPYPIVITARPMGFLDRRFAVSEGQCGMLEFGWKKRRDYRIADAKEIGFELKASPGYRVLGTTFGDLPSVRSEPCADGGTTVRMRMMDGLRPGEMMNSYRTLGVLIAPEPGAREGRFSIAAYETKSGKKVSPKESIVLYVVPPVRAGAVPKRYLNGLDTSVQHWFRSAEAYRPLARTWFDIGARWLLQKCEANDFIPYWRELPDTVVTPYWEGGLENGFCIGNGAKRPPGDRFVFDPEHPKIKGREWFTSYLAGSTCPMAIYEERPYFLESIVPDLAARLKGANGMWANWEPSQFERKGCYCENCKREFAKFARLPQEEVDATWPKGFEQGEKWYAVGRKFRSWQHGRMIKVLNRHITRLTGGEKSMGFVPGVAWTEMTHRWITKDDPGEVKAVDYADELKWINAWGPYAYWFAPKPFRYRKHVSLNCWVAASEIAGRVKLDYRDGHRPRLMAYPNGFQCGSYVTTPEHLKMAMDSFLFNRWNACCPYFFPNGYDARYLKAYAEAVELSALAEGFVLDGRSANDLVVATPVKEYARPCKAVTAWLTGYTNEVVLKTAAFDLRGSRLVAALNFWEKAPAFFDLSNRGLSSGDYTVTSGDVVYVKDRAHPFWAAEELAAGVRLAVGAVRTGVFEIHPKAVGKLAGARRVMTAAALDGLYRKMRPELEAAAAADRLYERDAPREPWNSRMN